MKPVLLHPIGVPATVPLLAVLVVSAAGQALWAADLGPAPEVSAAVVSIDVGSGHRTGSGLIVDPSGLVVTSYALASAGDRARITLQDGTHCDVSGYVAVRKSRDLVLLAIKKPVPKLFALTPHRKLPKIGENVLLHGGPQCHPFVFTTTTVRNICAGDEIVAGRQQPEAGVGDNPDTCWLITDSFLPGSGLGGAVLTADGRLLGMLTASPEHGDRVHAAIHAEHIARLLEQPATSPKPLSSLRKYEDVPASVVPTTVPQPFLASGVDDRSSGAARWIASLRRRLTAAESSTAEFRPHEDALREEAKKQVIREKELTAEIQGLQQAKAAIKPEVPRPVRKVITYQVVDKSGMLQLRQDTVLAVDYEYSLKQREQVANLDAKTTALQKKLERLKVEIELSQYRIDQVASDLAAAKRRVESLWNELFLLGDPLEIRNEDEDREILAEIPSIAEALGTNADYLLTKALLHLRLRELDLCEQAAEQAGELDKSVGPIVQAIQGRCALLNGQSGTASSVFSKLGRKGQDDPRIPLLMARYELDRGNAANALKQIRMSGDRGADATEIDLLLGLLYATAPQKSARDPKKALFHAGRACEATHWKDWRCLAALSAANAESKGFAAAGAVLDRAEQAAPPSYEKQFTAWRDDLLDSRPVAFPWK